MFTKGMIPWNKGIKTGLVPKTAFKKGRKTWCEGKVIWPDPEKHPSWKGGLPSCEDCGKKLTQRKYKQCIACYNINKKTRTIEKLKTSHIGQKAWNKGKKSKISKENHPNWKGGVTPTNHLIRNSIESKQWVKTILSRDNYECQMCGEGGYLEAHHIKRFCDFPELRFEINNGISLCKKCHKYIQAKEHEWESYFNFNLEVRNYTGSAYLGMVSKFA